MCARFFFPLQHEALCRLGMLRLSRAEAIEQDLILAIQNESDRLASKSTPQQEADQDLLPAARRQRERAEVDALARHAQQIDAGRRRRTELLAGAEQALREAAANGSEKALGYLGTTVGRTGRLGLAAILLRKACDEQTRAAVGGPLANGGRAPLPGETFFECGLAATHEMLGDCLGAIVQKHAGLEAPEDTFNGSSSSGSAASNSSSSGAHEVPMPSRAEAATDAVSAYRVSARLKPTSADLHQKLGLALLAKASSLEPYYSAEVKQSCAAQGLSEPLEDDQASVMEAEVARGVDLDAACQAFDLVLHFTRAPGSGESGDGRGVDAGDLSPEADPVAIARAGQMHYDALFGAGVAHLRRRRFLRAAALFRRCRALRPMDGAPALRLGCALLQEVQCRVAAFDGDSQAAAAALAAFPGRKETLWRKQSSAAPPPQGKKGSASATQEYWRNRFLRAQRGAAQPQDSSNGKNAFARVGTVFAAMLEPPAIEHSFVAGPVPAPLLADDAELKQELLPECVRELQHAKRLISQPGTLHLVNGLGNSATTPPISAAVGPTSGAAALADWALASACVSDLTGASADALITAFRNAADLASALPAPNASSSTEWQAKERPVLEPSLRLALACGRAGQREAAEGALSRCLDQILPPRLRRSNNQPDSAAAGSNSLAIVASSTNTSTLSLPVEAATTDSTFNKKSQGDEQNESLAAHTVATVSGATIATLGGVAPLPLLLQLGAALMNEGDAATAHTVFSGMLKRRSSHGGARYRLGTALAARGDFTGAATHFTVAAGAEPWNGRHHFGLAAVLQRHAAMLESQASAAVDAAARAGPLTARQATVSVVAAGTLGQRRKARKLVRRATKAWRRAIRRGHGGDPEAWFGLGVGLAYLGDGTGACAAFWKVLDLLPTFWAVYFRLGALLEHELRFDDAARLYASCLKRAETAATELEVNSAERTAVSESALAVPSSSSSSSLTSGLLFGPLRALTRSREPPQAAAADTSGVAFAPSKKPLKAIRVRALVCMGAARAAQGVLAPVLATAGTFGGQGWGAASEKEATEAGVRGALTPDELKAAVMAPGAEAASALDFSKDRWQGDDQGNAISSEQAQEWATSAGSLLLGAVHDLLGLEAGGALAVGVKNQAPATTTPPQDAGVKLALTAASASGHASAAAAGVASTTVPGPASGDPNVAGASEAKQALVLARESFSNASREDPQNAAALFGLALCCELSGDWDAAVATYRLHCKVAPRSANGYLRLSTLLRLNGAVDEAVMALSFGMRLKPSQAGVVYRYALLREAQGEVQQAVAAFRQTLAFDPSHLDAYFHLGRLLLVNAPPGKDGLPTVAEAAQVLERAVALDGNQRDCREHLAHAYTLLGQHAAALRQRQAVKEAFPTDPSALVACGLALEKVNRHGEAASLFSAVAQRQQRGEGSLRAQTDVEGSSDQWENGATGEEGALATAPQAGAPSPQPQEALSEGVRSALHRLAVVHARKGQLDRASQALRASCAGLDEFSPGSNTVADAASSGAAPPSISITGFDPTETLLCLGHVLLSDWEASYTPPNAPVVTGARGQRFFAHLFRPKDLVLNAQANPQAAASAAPAPPAQDSNNAAAAATAAAQATAAAAMANLPEAFQAKLQVFDPVLQQWSPRIVRFGGEVGNTLYPAANPYLELHVPEVDPTDPSDLEPLSLGAVDDLAFQVPRKLVRLVHACGIVSIARRDETWTKVEITLAEGPYNGDNVRRCSATSNLLVLHTLTAKDAASLEKRLNGWLKDWTKVMESAAAPLETPAEEGGAATGSSAASAAAEAAMAGALLPGALDDARLAEATDAFQKALARDEVHVSALMALAECHRRRSQWRSAEPLLQRAVRLAPKNACVAFALAQTLEKLGRVSEASALFRTTNELLGVAMPNLGKAFSGEADSMGSAAAGSNDDQDNDEDESEASQSRAMVLYGGSEEDDVDSSGLPMGSSSDGTGTSGGVLAAELAAVACYRLGRLLLVRGQRLEALASLSRAVALLPTLSEAYAVLGTMLYEERRDDAAVESFRQMLSHGAASGAFNVSSGGDDDDGGGMAAAGIWYKLGLALAAKGAAAAAASVGGDLGKKAAAKASEEAAQLSTEAVEALMRAVALAEQFAAKPAPRRAVGAKGPPPAAPWNWYDSLGKALVQAGKPDDATRYFLVANDTLALAAAFGKSAATLGDDQGGEFEDDNAAATRVAASDNNDDAMLGQLGGASDPRLPFDWAARAAMLESIGLHLLRCWVNASQELYAPPRLANGQPSAGALVLAGVAGQASLSPGGNSAGEFGILGSKWVPTPVLFVPPSAVLPAPPTEPLTADYDRAVSGGGGATVDDFEYDFGDGKSPNKKGQRTSFKEGSFKEGSFKEGKGGSPSKDPRRRGSFKEPSASSAIDRDALPGAPFGASDPASRISKAEWSSLLAEASSMLAQAQRLRAAHFIKLKMVDDDEFGIMAANAAAAGDQDDSGFEASDERSSSAISKGMGPPTVLVPDAPVTDPALLAAVGAPLTRPTLYLACALLGVGTPSAASQAEALFSGILASYATRAQYPGDVALPGFADAMLIPANDGRGDACVGLGLIELCTKGHAALSEKMLRRGLALACGAPAEVHFWCARAVVAAAVARAPRVVGPGAPAVYAGGEGVVQGQRALADAAAAYRTCLALLVPEPGGKAVTSSSQTNVLPLWHGLHAAVTLAGLLIGQGLLLEATKMSRRAVQQLEPLLRKWVAPMGEALRPGSSAKFATQGIDPFLEQAPPSADSAAAKAATAARAGPVGRRRAEPLFRLAAAAHEVLGDALMPRGLMDEADVAYRRAMQWRALYGEAHTLMGGGVGIAAVKAVNRIPPAGASGSLGIGFDGATANGLVGAALVALRRDDDAERAAKLLQRALELQGEDGGGRAAAEAHLFLGDALKRLRKYEEALGEYALAWQAVDGDADDGGGTGASDTDGAQALRAAAAHACGVLELQRGNPAAAAAAFADAVSADPRQAMAFKGLGVSLNASGQWAAGGAALAVAAELSARVQPATQATFAAAAAATALAANASGKAGAVARRAAMQMGDVGQDGQLQTSFRGDGLVSFHRAFSLWASGDVKAAAQRFGEATHMAPRYCGSYGALAALLAVEGAPLARRDCEYSRLAPEPVMLALRMAAGAPSVVKDDGLRKKDSLLECVRRLKLVGELDQALALMRQSALKIVSGPGSESSKKSAKEDAASPYNTRIVPAPVASWADDSELWCELGTIYEALGWFPEAAEAYGRVKNTVPEYAVAEKAARECGAVNIQRAVLASKNKFERAAVNDPAQGICPLPPGACRLLVPEPPGVPGAAGAAAAASGANPAPLSRAKLATQPKKKVRLISAIVWLPKPQAKIDEEAAAALQAAEVDAAARLAADAAAAAADAAEAATQAAAAAAPKQRPSLFDQAESWGASAWGEVLKVSADLDAQVTTHTGLQVGQNLNAAAEAAQAAAEAAQKAADESGATAFTQRITMEAQLAAHQAARDAGQAAEEQWVAHGGANSVGSLLVGSPARDLLDPGYSAAPEGEDYLAVAGAGITRGPPKLTVRMPGLPPGWCAVVPLYSEAPTAVGQDAPKSSTPLMGKGAKLFYYHVGLHVTLRAKPDAPGYENAYSSPAAEGTGSSSKKDSEVPPVLLTEPAMIAILQEDAAGMRALYLQKYKALALREGLDLPPQQAIAAAQRFSIRRYAAARSGPVMPPTPALAAQVAATEALREADAEARAASKGPGGEGDGESKKKKGFARKNPDANLSLANLVVGAFQPPFADFDVTFDAEFDLPLLMKIKGVALPYHVSALASNAMKAKGMDAGGGLVELPGTAALASAAEVASHWLFVTGFAPGDGAAERSGQIKPWDLLLAVNGIALRGRSFDAAIRAIARQPQQGPLVLKFRRSLVLSPPLAVGDPGSVQPASDQAEHDLLLEAAAAEGVKKGVLLAKRGEGAEGATMEGREVFGAMTQLACRRKTPLPHLANLPFPAPMVVAGAAAGPAKSGKAASSANAVAASGAGAGAVLSTALELMPVVEGWVPWITVDGVALQSISTVLRRAWGISSSNGALSAASRRGSLTEGGIGSLMRKPSLARKKSRTGSFTEGSADDESGAGGANSLAADPPRVYLSLRRDTKVLSVSRSTGVGGGVASAFEGGWDLSASGRLKSIEVIQDPNIKDNKDASGGGELQFGPLPWQVWLSFKRTELVKDINDATSAQASASSRHRGGTGLVVSPTDGVGSGGLYGTSLESDTTGRGGVVKVGWDGLGDPYGGNAKTVVLCFPSEPEARHWAEALGSINVSSLKSTRPRRLKERSAAERQALASQASAAQSRALLKQAAASADASAAASAAGAAAERRAAEASVADGEATSNPTMFARALAHQGLVGAGWERLRVTIPRRAGKAMLLKLKGVACGETVVRSEVKTQTGRKKMESKVIEARVWPVVTGFSRLASGKPGAAEASKQVKPLDVLVAVDDVALPRNDFFAAACMIQAEPAYAGGNTWDATRGGVASASAAATNSALGAYDEDDDENADEFRAAAAQASGGAVEDEPAMVTLTLWRNGGCVAPLAEGWAPHVVILDGRDSSAAQSGNTNTAIASSLANATEANASGIVGGNLRAQPGAVQGLSPRRYLVLSATGLLKMHAPSASGALDSTVATKLHLRNVHSLQKVLDDATGRWQLLFWLKAASAPASGEPAGNSGRSVIVAFNSEEEMMLWLDVLSTMKVPQNRTNSGQPEDELLVDEDTDDFGGKVPTGDSGGKAFATVPVLPDLMRVRSKGGRRLPRVSQPQPAGRSGMAASRATLPLLDSFDFTNAFPGGGIGGGGGAGSAAAQAAEDAAEAAAFAAKAFAADPQAAASQALRDIFGSDNGPAAAPSVPPNPPPPVNPLDVNPTAAAPSSSAQASSEFAAVLKQDSLLSVASSPMFGQTSGASGNGSGGAPAPSRRRVAGLGSRRVSKGSGY